MAMTNSQKNVRAQTIKKQQIQSHSGTGQPWTESVIATVVHFIFFLCYAAIIMYDKYVMRNCPNLNKYFPGLYTYGGRGKFLTYITMHVLVVYFCIALLTDLIPRSNVKTKLLQFVDCLFTTTIWPLAWVVCVLFWVLYALDRDYIYPEYLDEYLPTFLNHLWHTVPFFIVIVESLLVHHRYPSNLIAGISLICVSLAYLIWVIIVHEKTGKWVYPFMKSFNFLIFFIFAIVCSGISGVFYYIGIKVCCYRWGDSSQYSAVDKKKH